MNADELAWAAGMFEGEGSIVINASSKGEDVYRLQCKVPSTDNDIIEFFREHWPKGCISPSTRENRQPLRNWIVSGENARAFLEELKLHLQTERVQKKRDLAFRFQELKKERRKKQDAGDKQRNLDEQRECYDEMKRLNLRGAAANRRTQEE